MVEKEQIQKLIELEKRTARKSGFRTGLIVGIFIPILFISVIMITLILGRSYVEKKAGELIVARVMTEVFSAFPDAYFTLNRERIITVFDDFTNAASNHKIDAAEFRQIGQAFLTSLKDKQLTYGELDHILELMKTASE